MVKWIFGRVYLYFVCLLTRSDRQWFDAVLEGNCSSGASVIQCIKSTHDVFISMKIINVDNIIKRIKIRINTSKNNVEL